MLKKLLAAAVVSVLFAFPGCAGAPPADAQKTDEVKAVKETPPEAPAVAPKESDVEEIVETEFRKTAITPPVKKDEAAKKDDAGDPNKIAGFDNPNDALKAASDMHAEGGAYASQMADSLEKRANTKAKEYYYMARDKYMQALKIYQKLSEIYTPEAGYTGLEENIRALGQEMEDLNKMALPGW
jgi:siderophore synthetase component